jgi:hypothetical protein
MRPLAVLFSLLALAVGVYVAYAAESGDRSAMSHAAGTFDVEMTPQPPDEAAGSPPIGRMVLDKTYHGDLEAAGRGQMLALRTETEGSAGYVAMEQVAGKLAGKSGSFVLQHSGTMNRGAQHLDLSVVPDSGTGELVGLAGSMKIIIGEDGSHRYEMEYRLGD